MEKGHALSFDTVIKLVDKVKDWKFKQTKDTSNEYNGSLDSRNIQITIGEKSKNWYYLNIDYCGVGIEYYNTDNGKDKENIKELFEKIRDTVYETGKKRLEEITKEEPKYLNFSKMHKKRGKF